MGNIFKSTVFILIFLFIISACNEQKKEEISSVTIKGEIHEGKNGMVTLRCINPETLRVSDSLASGRLENGQFLLTANLNQPALYFLNFRMDKKPKPSEIKSKFDRVMFSERIVLENQADTVYFTVKDEHAQISGSELNDKVLDFSNTLEHLKKLNINLQQVKQDLSNVKKRGGGQKEYELQQSNFQKAKDELFAGQKKHILEQLDSDEDIMVKILLLESNKITEDKEIEFIDNYINSFSSTDSSNYFHRTYLSGLVENATKRARLNIGKKYLDFNAKNLQGQEITFSSLTGKSKYILLEFWASWCKPCRKEVPTMKKDYAKYHSKGFEIFGISIDNEKEAWIKASKEDNLPWINTLNNKEQENNARSLYLVRAVPTNFLIGPDGTILAKNLRGAALEEKLAEVFRQD